MKKIILSFAFLITVNMFSASLQQEKIRTYSFDSKCHVGFYALLGASIPGGIAWLFNQDTIQNNRSSQIVVASWAALGAAIGYWWSSYYTNEECFNCALSFMRNKQNAAVFNVLESSNDPKMIMKQADRVYVSHRFPRLVFMNTIEHVSAQLISHQYYLKRAINNEKNSEYPGRYLLSRGTELLQEIEGCIQLIGDMYPELKNDKVYLAQFSAQMSIEAVANARAANHAAHMAALVR